jgi:hypothetical protein
VNSSELTQPDRWGERILRSFPLDLQKHARDRWVLIANTGPKYPGLRHRDGLAPHAKANLDLAALKRELSDIKFSATTDDADICEAAMRLASLCEFSAFDGERIAEHFGIECTWPKGVTDEGKQRRFCDARWWRKKLRSNVGRAVEESMRRRGLVRFGKAVYVTDWALRRFRGHRSANRAMLDSSVVVNEEGTQLDLAEIAAGSVSNPALRRKEMMLRARGFEEIARSKGYTWTFATLTAASAFHPQLRAGGDNPSYAGFSVRESQRWLCTNWERSRATFEREGIDVFGFRVAEPHHDGTPHWHALLFVKPEHIERLEEILRDQWLSEYGEERGALEYRVEFAREDANRPGSSAAGYIAKYIGKNIDGHGVEVDYETRLDGAEASERATAWASVHGIRQFQQIGGPAVGLWRELRRLRDPVTPEEIEAARVQTSKPASWSGFVNAIGGIEAGRETQLQLWKKPTTQPNRYGEARAPVVIGVCSMLHWIRTRVHEWRIERKASEQKSPGQGRWRSSHFRSGAFPWTRVNNCTRIKKRAGADGYRCNWFSDCKRLSVGSLNVIAEAQQRLEARANDKRLLLVPGLADDLRLIGEALAQLSSDASLLARVVLQKHYWPGAKLLKEECDGLAILATDEEAQRRIELHGEGCMCELCFRGG